MRSTQSVPVLAWAWAVRGNVGVGAGLVVGVALAFGVGYGVALTVGVGLGVGSRRRCSREHCVEIGCAATKGCAVTVALLPRDVGKQTCPCKQRR